MSRLRPTARWPLPISPKPTIGPSGLLAHQVRDISVVLIANGFKQFAIWNQLDVERKRPWLGVCLQIVDRDSQVHMPKVAPPEPLGGTETLQARKDSASRPACEGFRGPSSSAIGRRAETERTQQLPQTRQAEAVSLEALPDRRVEDKTVQASFCRESLQKRPRQCISDAVPGRPVGRISGVHVWPVLGVPRGRPTFGL